MNELLILRNGVQTCTSLQIAEWTGKRHDHVVRDIRVMLEQGVNAPNFGEGTYTDKKGQERPCYYLTKKGVLLLASGYNVKLREAIIDRWEALENGTATPMYQQQPQQQVPQTFAQALRLAAEQQEQIETQQRQLEAQQSEIRMLSDNVTQMQSKVSYLDRILQCTDTVLTTIIGQDYGMSALKFNKLLHSLGIQHRVGKVWVINSPYIDKNYVKDVPFTYRDSQQREHVTCNTQWTQKGREWLYDKLKSSGILPLCERDQLSPIMA